MKMRCIPFRSKPRLFSVAISFFLSIISIESEPIILKLPIISINVRIRNIANFSDFITL